MIAGMTVIRKFVRQSPKGSRMAIRFECEQCGSVLKIKDDLAGKPGKCPKCKTAFTVPEVDDSPADSTELDEPSHAAVTKPSALKAPSTAPEDFDVDDFLATDPDLESKSKSSGKSKSRAAPPSDFDEDALLSDEPTEKPKGKSKTSSRSSDEGDEDEVFQIRRNDQAKPNSSKQSSPPDDDEAPSAQSRRPPGTNAAGTAANMASDLLSKTGKKGKKGAWSEAAEDAKQESEYDYTDLKNYLFKKLIPMVVGAIVLCVLLYLTASSMFGSKTYLPNLGQVTGTVTLNGSPVANVTVLFHPIQVSADRADKKKRASSSGGTTTGTGHYELKYSDAAKGAAVGECYIAIEAPSRSDIPPKYMGPNFTVKKTVKFGRQVIDINLSE